MKFVLKKIYGLEEDIVLKIPRWLFNAGPSLTSKWNEFSFFVKPICLLPPIKFLLKRIYGLEDDDL